MWQVPAGMAATCLIAVLAMLAQTASTQELQTALKAVAQCPTEAAKSSMVRVDVNAGGPCLIACAIREDCLVAHFAPADRGCFHGDAGQVALWSAVSSGGGSDGCLSFVRDSGMSAVRAAVRSVLDGIGAALASKLLVLFDFRRGFSNLARPGRFDATPHGSVTRDGQGARFPGGSVDDFIEVDTENGSLVTAHLDYSNSFTFYTRVVRKSAYSQNYHFITDDPADPNYIGIFGDRSGRTIVDHHFYSVTSGPLRRTVGWSNETFLLDNMEQLVSAGAVLVGGNRTSLFVNGSFVATDDVESYARWGHPAFLRLGFHPTRRNIALNGRMICYTIAGSALTLEELQQLEAACS